MFVLPTKCSVSQCNKNCCEFSHCILAATPVLHYQQKVDLSRTAKVTGLSTTFQVAGKNF